MAVKPWFDYIQPFKKKPTCYENIYPPPFAIRFVIVFLLSVAIQCAEDTESVKKINKGELETILINSIDFKTFIEIHHKNLVALSQLNSEDEEKIINYWRNRPNSLNPDVSEILQRIEFDAWPLQYLTSLSKSLNKHYVYDDRDLVEIISDYLSRERSSQVNSRTSIFPSYEFLAGIGCTFTCNKIAEETYPKEEDTTQRTDVWTGCFKCCMAACGVK